MSLGCKGGCPPFSLAGSASPFPVLTSLLTLFNTLARIHKGLCGQVSPGHLVRFQAGGQDARSQKESGEGTPWGKEASAASTHFSEFGWGESRHLGTPRRDQRHLLVLNKLAFPQLAAVLAAPGLQSYFLQCVAPLAAPLLTPFSVWALRHEYHLQYLALTLAQRAVGTPKPPLRYLLPLPHIICILLL